ncbi:MAG: 3-dehydroquinate synthase [Chloroflexi bacterium]|nr:3-dehydroquinate synthase [Chloroflexota bacterium]
MARRLRWEFVDTDTEIEALAGKSVPDIFSQDGEGRFREIERQVITGIGQRDKVVIATGGGAVLDPQNREAMSKGGVVVCLEARPQTIYRRLQSDAQRQKDAVVRPLLRGPDPLGRIEKLKEWRQPYYAMADWTVHTDALSQEEVVEEVLNGWRYSLRRFSSGEEASIFPPVSSRRYEADAPYCDPVGASFVVRTSSQTYPVYAGWGILKELGNFFKQARLGECAVIISDDVVFSHHGKTAVQTLKNAGISVFSFVVPQGEKSKTLEAASQIYDWLVEHRVERGCAIVALGGGMVGDLAGFVAATFLRGLPFVQAPTSLLAMVDAAIGGKVAVNHPKGKNLVGAFYQPSLVVMDVETLTTLPPRELTSGWAEVIKHAMILDPGLFAILEENSDALTHLERGIATEVVQRSAALKAKVVEEDEKETTGRRTILNYGHTIAHGLETATDYADLLHGEAVAIGMMGATMISQRMGLIPREVVEAQRRLLEKFGLPTSRPAANIEAVSRAIELDKKVKSKAVRWVLLKAVGETTIRSDVPQEIVRDTLLALTR